MILTCSCTEMLVKYFVVLITAKLEAVLELLKDDEHEDESEDLIENEGDEIDEIREARKLLIDVSTNKQVLC